MDNMIESVNIVGVSCCIPSHKEQNSELPFSQEQISKAIENTGVEERPVVDTDTCASDLCFQAALNLLSELNCDPSSIDVLIFVSQTPDRVSPATACMLQDRLKLSTKCMAFDINLGCSGYTYGLIITAQLLSTGLFKKALLLTGDTTSKVVDLKEKSVAFLFGDAGAATLLEHDPLASPLFFDYGTDGAGFDKLSIKGGQFRESQHTYTATGECSKPSLFMSGPEILSFTLREVPSSIHRLLSYASWSKEEVDIYFFHQANRFMLEFLAKKIGIQRERLPIMLQQYGNTSVASIPLTMCLSSEDIKNKPFTSVLIGFGVGFSWAAVAYAFKNTLILPVVEYQP